MKIYRCQHCNYNIYANKEKGKKSAKWKMGYHYETKHKNLIPPDMTGYQWFYFLLDFCKKEKMYRKNVKTFMKWYNEHKDEYKRAYGKGMVQGRVKYAALTVAVVVFAYLVYIDLFLTLVHKAEDNVY